MPRVPNYDNLQTSVAGAPSVQFQGSSAPGGGFPSGGGFQSPSGPTPGEIAGEQASAFGRAATGAGDAMGNIAMDMAQQVNETRVIDAVNRAKERMFDLTYNKDDGYTMQKGINALERPDGVDLATEYTQRFQKEVDGISGSLGNNAQKKAFADQAGKMRTEMYGSAEHHMSGEFTRYQGSVYDGAIVNAQRQIALDYTDVAKGGAVERGVATIEAATRAKARLVGMSQIEADGQVFKAVSNAHTLAIATALEKNDVAFADGYLKKFGKQMDADDVLKMQGRVTKEMDLRTVEAVAGQAVTKVAPKVFNTDFTRAFKILIGTETNGQQFAKDGKTPLTSSAGAVGIAQVLKTTGPEAAKLAGLPWDENKWKNDEDYNLKLGAAYFKEQLRVFDGRLPLAYAAYNAGPGAVKDYRDGTNTTGKNPKKIQTPDGIPPFAETQAYVKKNMKEYDAGGGRWSAPTMLDVAANVRELLGPDAKPHVVQAAVQRAHQNLKDLTDAKTAQDTENTTNAMRELLQNGGKWSELPASTRGSVPPKDVVHMINFAASIAKGDNSTNSGLYLKLTDPKFLMSMDDNTFFKLRGELDETDFKHFSKERAKIKDGLENNTSGDLNTQAINETLISRLRQLKIDPTPKDGSTDAATLGTVHRFARTEIAEAQRMAGKKFTDVETAQFIDKLFSTNVEFRNFFWRFTNGTSSQSLMSLQPGDIPSDVRKQIEKDLALRGNLNPTPQDLLGVYMKFKSKTKPAQSGVSGNY